jgi:F0F1-type ATP synthase assembly protein I
MSWCLVGSEMCIRDRWKSSHPWGLALLALATFFAASAAFAPKVLQPLNELWFQIGIFLGRFVSPVVLGLIFFLLITPIALCMRLAGRDALRMRNRQVSSYWLDREPTGPTPDSFKQQF